MCGIFGFFLRRPLREDDLMSGRRATEALRHRGPDGAGEWFDVERGIYLGHRRLAIIDLSDASAQPVADGRAAMTYNGEVYNYLELREILIREGVRFGSSGDVEVLFQSWLRWGPRCLDRFDGMFAFALFDGERLHLVTDPFGEKPLYWARTAEGVYFASEAIVLQEMLKLQFAPSSEELGAFMALGFIPPPRTGFPSLSVMGPASHLVMEANGSTKQRTYWFPPRSEAKAGKPLLLSESQIDEIGAVILESLRFRLRADVPLGLFLSSGVDSSLIAALSARELGVAMQCFTVSFPDGKDESSRAAEIARYLALPHVLVDSSDDPSGYDAPRAIQALYGVLNDNTTVLAVRQISRLARKYMKVALSGLGGDEAFFGYRRYAYLYKHRRAYRYMSPAINWLGVLKGVLQISSRGRTAVRMLEGPRAQQYFSAKTSGLGAVISRLPGALAAIAPFIDADPRDLSLAARDLDTQFMLPGSYIPPVDRGSMREGLEVRTPFLSRRLFTTLSRFDPRTFMAFGEKSVPRRLLSRYLPAHLTDAPKSGFIFPLNRYMRQRTQAPLVNLAGAPHDLAAAIWQKRQDPSYLPLAFRLCVLEAFENAAAQ